METHGKEIDRDAFCVRSISILILIKNDHPHTIDLRTCNHFSFLASSASKSQTHSHSFRIYQCILFIHGNCEKKQQERGEKYAQERQKHYIYKLNEEISHIFGKICDIYYEHVNRKNEKKNFWFFFKFPSYPFWSDFYFDEVIHSHFIFQQTIFFQRTLSPLFCIIMNFFSKIFIITVFSTRIGYRVIQKRCTCEIRICIF